MRQELSAALFVTVFVAILFDVAPEITTYAWVYTSMAISNWLYYAGMDSNPSYVAGFLAGPAVMFSLLYLFCLAVILAFSKQTAE